MFTIQALQVLTYLVPGFVASMILDALVVRQKRNDLAKVIEALAFTLVIFAITAIAGKSPIDISISGDKIIYQYEPSGYIWLLLVTVGLPIVLSYLITHDLHMGLARALRMSKKTSRATVWVDVFYDLNDYITINFKDERRLVGWPRYFSHDPESQYIFLEDASWIVLEKNGDGEEIEVYQDIKGQGILVTANMEIESIEVMQE